MNMDYSSANILIVDDNAENLEILEEMLSDSRYRITPAQSGAQALEIAQKMQPDLILLDVIMPEMDGFETCRQLKSKPTIEDTPIIFVTAKTGQADIEKGFEVGAVDYIIKPFKSREVLARTKLHISLHQYQRQLEEQKSKLTLQKAQLEGEVAARKKIEKSLRKAKSDLESTLKKLIHTQNHLVQSERMAGLGNLVMGVAHEINTPLGIGIAETSFLEEKSAHYAQSFEQGALSESNLKDFFQFVSTVSASIMNSLTRLSRLMSVFRQVSVNQVAAEPEALRFRLKQKIEDVILSFQSKLAVASIKTEVDCSDEVEIFGYPLVIFQIFSCLIGNTLQHGFTESDRGKIRIVVNVVEDVALIRYRDNGVGMNQEVQKQIFDPFFTTKRGNGMIGLGMYIVYNLVTQKLNGSIRCLSTPNAGTEFIIEMPSG